MPMIRYQIRNEYSLADPELYGAADPDDPEAILEGVAMAGLVGVLRQLGDLAEFAAELFHELHEEVIATVGRGHGLMLRVQQLEAEFPSIEKAFLSQTSHSNFAYNAGVDWHGNLQTDQNFVTRGDMPRFILNSYEECRGPPRLFMLDKFDGAGAGACLKRYTDPSFFKMELASSGMIEADVPRERKTRKIKKKVLRWRNGEFVESFLVPLINSNLQSESSEKGPEKTLTRRVKLKSRHLNAMDTSNKRSYMESLLEVHSPEQKVLLEGSVNQLNKKRNSIDLNESAPEVHEIVIDNSDKYLSFRENPAHTPTKQMTELSTIEQDKQKLNGEEFLKTLPEPLGEIKDIYSTFHILEKKEVLTDSENNTDGSVNSYKFGEAEKSALALHEDYQHKFSADTEYVTEGFADSFVSDDIGSEVENYMDAMNTMESEIETDSGSKFKSDTGLFNVGSQGMLSDNNKGQQELVPQFSEPDFVESSTVPLGLENVFYKGMSSLSNSDDLGNMADTQPPQRDVISFDMPANSENTFEEIVRNGEVVEIKSSVHLLSDGTSKAEASIKCNLRSEIGEAFSDSCVTELTSTLICPQRSFNGAHAITSDSNEISPFHIKSDYKVADHLDHNLPCTTGIFDDSPFRSRDVPGKNHPAENDEELIPEDIGGTNDLLERISQKQDGSILAQVPTGYGEDLLLKVPEESRKQDTEACSGVSISPTTSVLNPEISSFVVQPDVLASAMENVMQPEDLAEEVSPASVRGTHEVVQHLNGSPFVSGDVPDKTHPTENDENLDSSQTQNGIILEEVPAVYVKHSHLAFIRLTGEPHQSIEQYGEACSDGSISPTTHSISPVASHTSLQPAGVATEMENFVVPSEESPDSQSAVDLGNADDIIKSKILLPIILPLELGYFSDAEEPRETRNVESSEFYPSCSGKETLPYDMQLHSKYKVIDGPVLGDDFRLPSGSTVSNIHKDALRIEQPIEHNDTLTRSVPAESVVDCHEPSSRYSLELTGFHIQSQEIYVSSDADLDQQNLIIRGASSPKETVVLHSERTTDVSLPPLDENFPVSDPAVSSSEFSDQDLFAAYDSSLCNGVCHTMPSEHAETNLGPDSDEENRTCSLEDEQDFSSRASPQYKEITKGSESLSTHFFEQPAIPVEEASEAPAVDEPNVIASYQEGTHLEASDLIFEMAGSVEQAKTEKNAVELGDIPSELGLEQEFCVMITDENMNELDIPPASTGICRQLEPEASVPSEFSSVHTVTSLAPNVSDAGLDLFATLGLATPESPPQQFSGPQISDPVLSFQLQEDVPESPPLPPLPPLEWRLGKLRLDSRTSDGSSFRDLTGTNPFMAQPTIPEWMQPVNPFAPLPALKDDGLLSLHNGRVQPLRLSELPPIVEDKRPQHAIQGEKVNSSNLPSLVSSIEDDQHLYFHDGSWGGVLQSSNPFAPSQSPEDEVYHHLHQLQGEKVQPLEDKRPQLGRLLPALELQTSQHGALSIDIDTVQSAGPKMPHHGFTPAENEKYQYSYGFYRGENVQHLNLSEPLPTSWEENPFLLDDWTVPTMEDGMPYAKPRSIRDRPRHPLMDAVAAHDKSKLRKISELVQPSARPEADQRDTLLDQIRNKSFNLKRTTMTKPNIKGPQTNLKVAAILERANAIRQACVGSDEDDDGDNWSDS